MRRTFLTFLSLFLYLCSPAFTASPLGICGSVSAQGAAGLAITAPQSGQVVQGLAVISGSVTLLGFSYYELAFAYEGDPTGTWFILQTSSMPVSEGELGTWDTGVLTDGDYSLRLRVYLLDGSTQETTVTGLRVRNYTAAPTVIPTMTETPFAGIVAPTALLSTPAPATVTPTRPTPTPLPPNPASLGVPSIYSALGRGALLALSLFLAIGFFLRLRRN